jgi:hypothetical protein
VLQILQEDSGDHLGCHAIFRLLLKDVLDDCLPLEFGTGGEIVSRLFVKIGPVVKF